MVQLANLVAEAWLMVPKGVFAARLLLTTSAAISDALRLYLLLLPLALTPISSNMYSLIY